MEECKVSPVPETRSVPRSAKDEFLFVACDGIWDVMSNEVRVLSLSSLLLPTLQLFFSVGCGCHVLLVSEGSSCPRRDTLLRHERGYFRHARVSWVLKDDSIAFLSTSRKA